MPLSQIYLLIDWKAYIAQKCLTRLVFTADCVPYYRVDHSKSQKDWTNILR